MTDLQTLRNRIADRAKANREVATGNGKDRSYHLQYENIYQVIVSVDGIEKNLATDYTLDGPSGRVVFLTPPANESLIAVDYLYSAFTDEELTSYIESYGLNGATVAALEELAADSSRFNDYSQGETSVKRSQIFSNLMQLLKRWTDKTENNASAPDGGSNGMSFISRDAGSHYDAPKHRRFYPDGSRADV